MHPVFWRLWPAWAATAALATPTHVATANETPAGFVQTAASPLQAGARLSLSEARQRVLSMSPELRAARSAAASAAGAARQANAWPNPEIEFEAEGVGGDSPGWDNAEITWSLSQPLDLFGTRPARARAARHRYESALRSADATRLDFLAEVDRRFADVLVTQARIEAYESSDSLAVEAVRAVRALAEAGEVSPIEVDRTEAERALVANQLRIVRFEHASAIRSLAQLWGSTEPDFSGVDGSLELAVALPDRDSLFSALARTPDLQRADAEVRRAEAEVSLAARERLPELAARGGLKRLSETDEHSYLVGFTLSLPVFDRRRGAVEEARGTLRQARAERDATESRIALDRATAYDALATAVTASKSLWERSVLRAQAVHAAVQEGYRRGKFGLLDLIDARRFLLQSRLDYIDALRSVWAARADLDRLTSAHHALGEGETR